LVLVDEDLLAYDRVWAAAGSPMHVFATTPAELLRISGGTVADVKEVA
jgi:prolyl-tRNA editing enzyme YbaK/EbsC (Cys-tRNA(Pro) deacylase)